MADLHVQHRAALPPQAVKVLQPLLLGARAAVDAELLPRSYSSWIGFYNTQFSTLQWSKEELARHANGFARATLGLSSPPALEEEALRNMSLLGVAGFAVKGMVRRTTY